jgi:hypothetical protein
MRLPPSRILAGCEQVRLLQEDGNFFTTDYTDYTDGNLLPRKVAKNAQRPNLLRKAGKRGKRRDAETAALPNLNVQVGRLDLGIDHGLIQELRMTVLRPIVFLFRFGLSSPTLRPLARHEADREL